MGKSFQVRYLESGFDTGMIEAFYDTPELFPEIYKEISAAVEAIEEEADTFIGVIASELSEVIESGKWKPGDNYIAVCLPLVIDVKYSLNTDLVFIIRNRRHQTKVHLVFDRYGETSIDNLEGNPFWLLSSLITAYTVWRDLNFSPRPN